MGDGSDANKKSISVDDAMKIFLGSKTYHVLNDVETGLYLEVYEFVLDMFLDEMGEDYEEKQFVN